MDYQVLELVAPYLDNESIFHALVSKEWLHVVKGHKPFQTTYRGLTSPTLLSYSHTMLNLVYTDVVAEAIIKAGDLETIKMLHSNYNLCDSKYMNSATKYGHLLAMKWLKDNGCGFSRSTFSWASERGNLLAMKWLKDNGCLINYKL